MFAILSTSAGNTDTEIAVTSQRFDQNIFMSDPVVSIDSSTLEKCYFENYSMLVGLARTLVDDLESAEEVVQHVFLKAAKNRVHFVDGDALNYIRIGVINESRSELRKRKTQRKYLQTVQHQELETDSTPVSALALHDALRTLPRRQRECVVLAYLENLSHKEIATQLNISIGSVKQHVARGVATLHKQLKDRS